MKLKNNTRSKENSITSAEAPDDRFNLKYQDKEYNESYKKWRRENKDSLAFYYVENPTMITYQDSVGFIDDHPEVQEEKALRRAVNILGFILIFRILFDVFSRYFVPALLGYAGFDIRFDFFTGKLFGDDTLILTVQFISGILSMILPVSLLIKHLHMPFRVMLPIKVTNKPMFRASVPVMLLISGVCSMMSTIYEQLLGVLRINTERTMLIPERTPDIIYLIITQMIILPAVSELCTRGVVLQYTRQFGDGIALIISAFITAALEYDITEFCFVFIMSVAIGYFTIRTGSVITAVIMRITTHAFAYVLYYLDYRTANDLPVIIFILSAIAVGTTVAVFYLYRHSDSFGMKLQSRYMPLEKKVLAFFTSAPIIIWLTANFIVSILSISFIS